MTTNEQYLTQKIINWFTTATLCSTQKHVELLAKMQKGLLTELSELKIIQEDFFKSSEIILNDLANKLIPTK